VVRRHDGDDTDIVELEPGRSWLVEGGHDVCSPGRELAQGIGDRSLDELHPDAGMRSTQMADRPCEDALHVRVDAGHGDQPRPTGPEVIGRRAEAVGGVQDHLTAFEQDRPGPREAHAPSRPLEEGHAHLPLQGLDLLPQSGLGHAQPGRGGQVRPGPGDLGEVTQLPELHAGHLISSRKQISRNYVVDE
jgi:hypothetical protein